MGVAIFVSFEREIPGIQGWDMGGKLLARSLDRLDRVARRLQLKPLSEFQSISDEEFADLVDPGEEPIETEPDPQSCEKGKTDINPEAAAELNSLAQRANEQLEEHLNLLRQVGPPGEEWFSAEEGLATVRGLIAFVKERPEKFRLVEHLVGDLEDVERYLRAAQEHGVRFHLSLDI
jgi:hypothetical protein